ncbi:MAG: hypothetical protein CO091_04215 [Candidatus Aquicultor secundus]|nr:MAG: hypothetical protein CO091_04215 [Candidatus Aquicultor secundus]
MPPKKVLVLDAMGVLYHACDDVKELLIPFVELFNKDIPADTIKRFVYRSKSGANHQKKLLESCRL